MISHLLDFMVQMKHTTINLLKFMIDEKPDLVEEYMDFF